MNNSNRTKLAFLFSAVCAATLLVIILTLSQDKSLISEEDLVSVSREGSKIVSAIDAYYVDKNTLPSSLDVLVPKYLNQVPVSDWGSKKWDYSPLVFESGYNLSISLHENQGYPLIFYTSPSGGWSVDQ